MNDYQANLIQSMIDIGLFTQHDYIFNAEIYAQAVLISASLRHIRDLMKTERIYISEEGKIMPLYKRPSSQGARPGSITLDDEPTTSFRQVKDLSSQRANEKCVCGHERFHHGKAGVVPDPTDKCYIYVCKCPRFDLAESAQ